VKSLALLWAGCAYGGHRSNLRVLESRSRISKIASVSMQGLQQPNLRVEARLLIMKSFANPIPIY